MSTKVNKGESEKVGLVPGDFLKRYDFVGDRDQDEVDGDDRGKVSPKAILGGIADPSMLYVATEDYQTEDHRQLSFDEGTQLVVLETCEDGKQL